MRLRLTLIAALVPLALVAGDPGRSEGQTAGSSRLEERIDETRGKIARRKGKERDLTTDIVRYDKRIATLQAGIDRIAARQATVQTALDAERAELEELQADLRAERARLVRLKARLREGRAILSRRLVELYQADKPDLVSVVLNANGFADLLQRSEFIRRIGKQDNQIVARVRGARAEAVGTIAKLDRLEARQAKVTAAVQSRRDEIATLKQREVDARAVFDRARAGKATVLKDVRGERKELEGHLVALEKEQAKVQAALANPSSPVPSGAYKGSGGQLAMPVNGTFTSPFGPRWGRLHAGVDLAAGEGTPIRAADSGRVVLAAWTGGYGNYTCVQHTSSMSTCYAHQSRYGTSQGAGVKRGQVIGYVGNTGHSFGAHLHFEVRINGNPVNPVPYL
jgi:murein DD-endopeptidase MepM/ murein hydrolase activator NlpD